MKQLVAGTGRCDITPAPGTPQGIWGAQTHERGLGADFPLYATALVVSDSHISVAIVDVDLVAFTDEQAATILQAITELTKIPRDHVQLACTHTHSGPNTLRLKTIREGRDMILDYLENLPRRIAGAVWQAQQNLRPVRCAAAAGRCEINVNRRLRLPDGQFVVGKNWDGPADPTVRVVRFDDLEENAVATIVHYACHPTTIAWQNQYFTPDYPGITRQVVEEQVGGRCLFLQGASGNVTPRRGFTGDLRVYHRLGRILGLEASKVALGIETLPKRERLRGVLQSGAPIALYEDESTEPAPALLKVQSREVRLPLHEFPRPEKLEAEAATLRRELERLRERGGEEEKRKVAAQATQTTTRADMARRFFGQTSIPVQFQAIRIGSVALLSVPGEPFTEINQEIVGQSPFEATLFCGLSNGYIGYIPTRRAFEEGGYEVGVSPFSPGAAEIVVKEGLQMLNDLAGDAS